jgi:hypothetical protein
MRTVNVDPNVFPVPTYRSAAEAIAAETSTTRAKRSSEDSLLIRGAIIREFMILDQEVRLSLSNDRSLHVFVVGGLVEWRISSSSDTESQNTEQRFSAMRLVWPSGAHTAWDPATLLDSRRPFMLEKLFAGQIFFNVYFRAGGLLQFLPLWNCSDESPFLHFFELEKILH